MKNKILYAYIFYIFVFVIIFGIYYSVIKARNLEPVQPINYSHRIHVFKLKLECSFCHQNIEKSTVAQPPPVSVCMDCHKSVKTESPEIKKLTDYFENSKPVPWIKIHKFKDWLYFSHKRHLTKGIECAFCHGNVEAMDRVRKVRSMRMGFCVKCHEIYKAPRECNVCHK